jgi:hypothetical protein
MGRAVGRLAVSQYFTEFGMSKPGPPRRGTWSRNSPPETDPRAPCGEYHLASQPPRTPADLDDLGSGDG